MTKRILAGLLLFALAGGCATSREAKPSIQLDRFARLARRLAAEEHGIPTSRLRFHDVSWLYSRDWLADDSTNELYRIQYVFIDCASVEPDPRKTNSVRASAYAVSFDAAGNRQSRPGGKRNVGWSGP